MKEIMNVNIEIPEYLQEKVQKYLKNKKIAMKDLIVNLVRKELITQTNKNEKFTIAIICGGPSKERGISLNSARSVADHLDLDELLLQIFYMDQNKNIYNIDKGQLYSNTPSDFDFKLSNKLTNKSSMISQQEFINMLKKVDLAFPLIHGEYGEDGEFAELCEKNHIPFVGSGSVASKQGFNKAICSKILQKNGFFTFPFLIFEENKKENEKIIERFFELNKLKKAVVKPANGGSSIGVNCVYSYIEAIDKVKKLFNEGLSPILIEPFCKGKEFTTVILENPDNKKPVALIPSEVDMKYENYQIFDYRRKYLPTQHTRYHTPARFKDEEIAKIQKYSEEIFNLFDFKDFIRMDGWLLDDGRIWFSDINIASGMEQNSFIFQQGTRIGLNHLELIQYIIKSACKRYNLTFPEIKIKKNDKLKNINVLFGGNNAERQVSLMSGTNVWLKLQKSEKLNVKAFLLDKDFGVWHLPYMFCLNHTVEEIFENCINAEEICKRLQEIRIDLAKKLNIKCTEIEMPKKYTFDEFIKLSQDENAFIFLGLHGGKGEDGTVQALLKANNLKFNGSAEEGSSICMDKYKTSEIINNLNDETITTAPKVEFTVKDFDGYFYNDYFNYWDKIVQQLKSKTFIIKPAQDGSSAGAVKIDDCNNIQTYVELLKNKVSYITYNTFPEQKNIVEMPTNVEQPFLIEAFIETDEIFIKNNSIKHTVGTGWLELTVAVTEKDGIYHSFNPSITVAENKILTIEEKFQGGTGINLTPPPEEIISAELVELVKTSIEKTAKALKIKNYARIDIFLNILTKKIIIIEANTLPALTPSTVIFHQALVEDRALKPIEFLELLIENAEKSK